MLKQKMAMETKKACLDTIPREVLMKILFPFCDLRSLKELSKVNPEWNFAVRLFMKEFNKVVIMTVDSQTRDILHFVAQQTTKLVKLNLIWDTNLKCDNNALVKVIQSNKALNDVKIVTKDKNHKLSLDFVKLIMNAITVIKPDFDTNYDVCPLDVRSISLRENLSCIPVFNFKRVSFCFDDNLLHFQSNKPVYEIEKTLKNNRALKEICDLWKTR